MSLYRERLEEIKEQNEERFKGDLALMVTAILVIQVVGFAIVIWLLV